MWIWIGGVVWHQMHWYAMRCNDAMVVWYGMRCNGMTSCAMLCHQTESSTNPLSIRIDLQLHGIRASRHHTSYRMVPYPIIHHIEWYPTLSSYIISNGTLPYHTSYRMVPYPISHRMVPYLPYIISNGTLPYH